MAAGYATNYGNTENNGLSIDTPKKSIQSALDAGLNPVYVQGEFAEGLSFSSKQIVGDGFAVLDGGKIIDIVIPSNYSMGIRNLTIRHYSRLYMSRMQSNNANQGIRNCIIKDVTTIYIANINISDNEQPIVDNCLIYIGTTHTIANATSCTFSNINSLVFKYKENMINHSNIISECNISFTSLRNFVYSLFHNCTFKFSGGGLGKDESALAAPIGSNDIEKMNNIRERMSIVYGGVAEQYFSNCLYQTDGELFVNSEKENYYLVPNCQAATMSYEAQFVGKFPECSVVDFASQFDSYSNIDTQGNIIDQTVDASAETNITDLGKLRHISSFEALGERAVRNGNQVNTNADLGVIINAGTNLTNGKTYIVRTEAIGLTASGKTRDIGETFIASATDGLAFISDTGYVQEVYLDKPRSIELKASKTDPTLAVTPWVKMDLYAEPKGNYDENGQLLYGNADVNYDEATSERLFIRYWKARITIKAKNLPS